ncbi:AMP-binding protein [Nocardia sp. NPDC059246]|uniref:AMP-binding protein n=1 Tax=unclassified Nocardia TaxID=2637762 RepID=UPI0036995360
MVGARQEMTYRQTADQVERTATACGALGLRPGDGIALLEGPRPEAFTVMAAACLAGLRYAALHPLGTAGMDTTVLSDSSTDLLVVDDRSSPERAARTDVRTITLSELGGYVAAAQPHSSDPRRPATYLFYTGGTTGAPKGVILGDRSLVANAWANASWAWPHDTNFLVTTPMSHAAGLLVAPGFPRGASFTLHKSFDPDRVIDAIEHHGISTTFVVPTMLYALLDNPRIASANTSGLRWIFYGAAPTDPERIRKARSIFGPVLLGFAVAGLGYEFDDCRHWHTGCWKGRNTRTITRRWS